MNIYTETDEDDGKDYLYYGENYSIFNHHNINSRYCHTKYGIKRNLPDMSSYLRYYRYEAMGYKQYTLRELYTCWNGYFMHSKSGWYDLDKVTDAAKLDNQDLTVHMNNLFSELKNRYYYIKKQDKAYNRRRYYL